MSTLGNTMIHVGIIMSTPGDVQYPEGYHEYTRGILVRMRKGCDEISGIFLLEPFAVGTFGT